MKLVYFDDFKLGVLKGDAVVDVSPVVQGHPAYRPGRSDERADRALRQLPARKLEEAAASGNGVPLSSVRIRPPLPKPRQHRLHGGQLHGRRHAQRAGADQRLPQDRRARSSATATRWCCPTCRPRSSRARPRLALVIGKKCEQRQRSRRDELHLRLHLNFIDGSARGLPPPGNVFFQMKSRDTFAPIGPYHRHRRRDHGPAEAADPAVEQRRADAELQHRRHGAQDPALHRVADLDPHAGAGRHRRHRHQPPRPQPVHGRRQDRARDRRARPARRSASRTS